MTMQIILEDISFYAHHGVLEQERRVGNKFLVSVWVEVSPLPSAQCDSLDGTVSYAEIFASVSREMSIPSMTLEHVAGRIARRLYTDFEKIIQLRIRITKCKPPIARADVRGASIELTIGRTEAQLLEDQDNG